jgi:hypothetical protein
LLDVPRVPAHGEVRRLTCTGAAQGHEAQRRCVADGPRRVASVRLGRNRGAAQNGADMWVQWWVAA